MAETLHGAVLHAMLALERRHGKTTFDLADIIEEVLTQHPSMKENSVRTQIVSVMCKDAPVHHANHTDDLERVGRGRYRRVGLSTIVKPPPARAATPERARLPPPTPEHRVPAPDQLVRPWHWEGRIQDAFIDHLRSTGWRIHSSADTHSREHGADVLAERGGEMLIAEVKGYPTSTYARGDRAGQPKPTQPSVQARTWFGDVLLQAMLRRHTYPVGHIAIVLPAIDQYLRLLSRVGDSLGRLDFKVFVVDEEGGVRSFSPDGMS